MSWNGIWKEYRGLTATIAQEVPDKEKNLGVMINNRLPPDHIKDKGKNTLDLLTNMKTAFKFNTVKKMVMIPTLEYAAEIWSPTLKQCVEKTGKVLRGVRTWVPSLCTQTLYEEKFCEINSATLEERKKR